MTQALYVGAYNEEKVTVPSGGYNPGDIVLAPSGNPGVVQGQRPLEEDEVATLCTTGKYEVASASGTTFSAGDIVGWNNTTKLAVAGGAGTYDIGVASRAKTSGQLTVQVLLHESTQLMLQNALTNAIADPGDGEAIPVTESGYVPIVTSGSETRTLAAPSFIGQQLMLYVKTDGGTCVITVASAINQTGNNTITMADVRDVIQLVAIESGANKVWHVVSNDGAALSTV